MNTFLNISIFRDSQGQICGNKFLLGDIHELSQGHRVGLCGVRIVGLDDFVVVVEDQEPVIFFLGRVFLGVCLFPLNILSIYFIISDRQRCILLAKVIDGAK